MGDGFGNPIVGGMSKLIRAAIQSPNYVAGLLGWSVNKDGSAEFNQATFRGKVKVTNANGGVYVYSGAAGAGKLIAALTSSATPDEYGNNVSQGLTASRITVDNDGPDQVTYPTTDYPSIVAYETTNDHDHIWFNANAGNNGKGFIFGFPGFAEVVRFTTALLTFPFASLFKDFVTFTGTWKFGAGLTGKYYAEQWSLSQNVAQNVDTLLTGWLQTDVDSDYNSPTGTVSQMAVGVWTCPVTGYYDFSYYIQFAAATGGTNRLYQVIISTNLGNLGLSDSLSQSSGTPGLIHVCRKITAGDTIRFRTLFGATPASRQASGLLTITRRV